MVLRLAEKITKSIIIESTIEAEYITLLDAAKKPI